MEKIENAGIYELYSMIKDAKKDEKGKSNQLTDEEIEALISCLNPGGVSQELYDDDHSPITKLSLIEKKIENLLNNSSCEDIILLKINQQLDKFLFDLEELELYSKTVKEKQKRKEIKIKN